MIYRRHSRDSPGFILFDAILGVTLAALLVSAITILSLDSAAVYERAAARSGLLEAFDAHATEFDGLLPYEGRAKDFEVGSSTVRVSAGSRWHGNDLIETQINVINGRYTVSFLKIRADPDRSDFSGTPLCSVSFGNGEPKITPITLPVDPLLPLTDVIVRNDTAWISADSASAGDPDLLIADIREPGRPYILSTINTGPGLSAIALSGNYVFAAAASAAAQLHVIKMSGPASLLLAKKYQLPLPEASTSPPFASSIFYDSRNIFLGTERWDGQEFAIIDVSNPENPSKTSGFETGGKISGIYVRKNRAYVAASDPEQFRVLDISNRSHPVLLISMSPSGWQRQDGKAVSYFEDVLGLGRTSGGFNIQSDKELFLQSASSSDPAAALDVPDGIYGMVMDRDRVFAITHGLDRELSVFDRGLGTSTARYHPLPVDPQAITCDGDRLYVLAKTAPVIYEVTFN